MGSFRLVDTNKWFRLKKFVVQAYCRSYSNMRLLEVKLQMFNVPAVGILWLLLFDAILLRRGYVIGVLCMHGDGSTMDRTATDPPIHLMCTGAPATPFECVFDPWCTSG